MDFSAFNDKYQEFVSDLTVQMGIVVQENEPKLLEMNRAQMVEGLTNKGQLIEPTYKRGASGWYAKYKKSIGSKSPQGIPDLKLTGDFHAGMFIEIDDRDYYIDSTDDKAPDLVRKYKDIFGLMPENQAKAKEINTKTLADNLKKYTGL